MRNLLFSDVFLQVGFNLRADFILLGEFLLHKTLCSPVCP